MLRSIACSGMLLLALATQGCDVGGSSGEDIPPIVDPSSLEIGDDTDLGAGDDFGPTPVELHGALHVSGTELRDEHEQKVQLRGVSSMWLNWETDGYAENLEGLKWLRNNWHVSVIRAAMGVEASGGYFANPEKAKAQVVQMVDNAIAAGVYVMIDWHTEKANEQTEQSVAFFKEMAGKYAGVPNVIFETFNEPTKQNWSTDLKPYHEAVIAGIREADPEHESVIVLGTSTWSQDVDKAALDPVVGKNLMYTLHFYACDHGRGLMSKAESALSTGLPLFVTEWCATNADVGTKC